MLTSAHPDNATSALVDWLGSTDAYPEHPATVEHIETHISHIFLAGEYVYKLKKTVRFDFLDFSTLAAREHACREELRLNRRLAENIYLDVVPITVDTQGRFALGGNCHPIDWLVRMRRVPLEKTMVSLHRAGLLRPAHIQSLAAVLSRFYKCQQPLQVDAEEYRQSFVTRVRDNREELLRDMPVARHAAIQRVHAFQLQLLQLQPALFAARVNAGRIFDGHGDLRPEHICFSDPIAIFDCIEFNDTFRRIDAVDELAFLATECEFLGATWVESLLFQLYRERSGDAPETVLIDFYKSYRAAVRGKVAALRAGQLDGTDRQAAQDEADIHLQLAERYASPHLRPLVVIVGGLSGTGKSTLAAALGNALCAEVLRSDVVRRELHCDDAQRPDRYEPQARQQVYDELFRRADERNGQRMSVVVDATFSHARSILPFRQFADRAHTLTLFIECECRPEVARQRIASRLSQGSDASEATPAVYDAQQQAWEPWPADGHHCRIDTEQPLAAQCQQVINALARQ